MEDKEIQEIFEKYVQQFFPNAEIGDYKNAFLQALHQKRKFLEKNDKNNTYTKLRDLLCSSYQTLSITRWLVTTKEGKYHDTTQLVSDKARDYYFDIFLADFYKKNEKNKSYLDINYVHNFMIAHIKTAEECILEIDRHLFDETKSFCLSFILPIGTAYLNEVYDNTKKNPHSILNTGGGTVQGHLSLDLQLFINRSAKTAEIINDFVLLRNDSWKVKANINKPDNFLRNLFGLD
tara:strand:+ start:245 stop:949 length:705 start_codon:yes stop_codon:yes gene_type:complete